MITYDGGSYDIIVIGAGHAGCEAALACARMGKHTLMLTMNLDSIALMACNPAIGGTGKGQLVREIDALGGEMAIAIDATMIQMRMLNTAKGPAVHSLRAQADKRRYHEYMKSRLENTELLEIKQAEVIGFITNDARICGVRTACGANIRSGAVIASTGVYLKSRIIIGEFTSDQGPSGLARANYLSSALSDLGLKLQRFKTGTPARLDKRSIDFSKTIRQDGDASITPFSFMTKMIDRPQTPCYLTYTNQQTHDIIRANLHRSPLYSGTIEGIGPRYCPSIEDKVVRFADKERHQLFLEPEGLSTNEIYAQGMSSSLSEDVQLALYRSIKGLENVRIMRPAYAIEYDCIDPVQMDVTLRSRIIDGLFTAGQINGTSGYEEAAAQGIVAGINAARYLDSNEPLTLRRDEAYAGVLIDDLVFKGTKEPYRMMTARAEYRLLLRQDNADERLTIKGREMGLVTTDRYDRLMHKLDIINNKKELLAERRLTDSEAKRYSETHPFATLKSGVTLADALRHPELTLSDIEALCSIDSSNADITARVETDIKYEGYIEKQKKQVERFRSLEDKALPRNIDYPSITGLRLEARAKLKEAQPKNLGQASRISGVSPSDIAVLTVYLAKNEHPRS